MPPLHPAEIIEAARDLVRLEGAGVSQTADQLDETFVEVAQLLLGLTGKVFVTGSGTSGFIARRMAHLLSVCGTPAVYLQPMDALHGTMGAVAPGDAVIAISKGGASREIVDLVGRVRDRGATTVALTAVSDSELGRGADICVTVTSSDEVDPGGVIAMGSTLATAVWGDALAYTLMRLRGYTWDEVLHSHPAGAVGQIEHAPAELPPLSLA